MREIIQTYLHIGKNVFLHVEMKKTGFLSSFSPFLTKKQKPDICPVLYYYHEIIHNFIHFLLFL